MNEILEFANNHPFWAFCIIALTLHAVTLPFRLFVRHLNIRKAGWPPEWCDADGDIHHKENNQPNHKE